MFTMKPGLFFSQFNRVFVACTLGATLVGLPATVVAQDSVSTSVEAAHSSHRKIYVHHTEWMVQSVHHGHKQDYHPVPWLFMPDGTARSGHLWHGTWYKKSKNTINVSIQMRDRSTDEFVVKFTSPTRFVAYKNGHAYRYGARK
jgi:hypothetical protein